MPECDGVGAAAEAVWRIRSGGTGRVRAGKLGTPSPVAQLMQFVVTQHYPAASYGVSKGFFALHLSDQQRHQTP